MSLYLDGYHTDPTDLREDLHLAANKTQQYFRELGCRISAPNEKDRSRFGIDAKAAAVRKVAKLEIPLQFPKLARQRPKGR
jgi:DNA-directed RNA polymerase I subunit RPA49